MASVDVLGVRIGCTDLPSLLQLADLWISGHVGAVVSYANAHVLNLAAQDSAFRALLSDADLVYPDGMSVVWAARMFGAPPLARTTGADWIDPLCAMASARGWRIAVVAGEPGVADRAVAVLRQRHPGLDVAVVAEGQLTAQREGEVLDELSRVEPDLVLVGMGAGVQERWIAAARPSVPSATWWAVGALFDYVAGVERRAPRWMGTTGLEWAFRLLQDPRGKWRRYVLGNPTFVARVLRERHRKGA